MPTHQMEGVMEKEFGSQWREIFREFSSVPLAAASIGQVHKAKIFPENSASGVDVAVKVRSKNRHLFQPTCSIFRSNTRESLTASMPI
jgi:predicted unusual protein kinase regulating ubiquinone biosynthesis (AarF/ABC1/UbiB family)